MLKRSRGQVSVELAVVLPLLCIFVMTCLQFILIFDTYLSVMNVARDAGRWLVIHPHTTDSVTRTTMNTRLPSNIDSSKLTLAFSPACASLTSGSCSGRNVNTQLAVTASYNISSLLFLPATFRIMNLTVQVPTTLPAYTIYMKIEPN